MKRRSFSRFTGITLHGLLEDWKGKCPADNIIGFEPPNTALDYARYTTTLGNTNPYREII